MMEPSQYKGLLKAAKSLDVSNSMLRDWFAGQSLIGLNLDYDRAEIVERAYAIADAMMEERGERGDENEPEPQFITKTLLSLNPEQPKLIAFRICSKLSRSASPQRPYANVEEQLEPQELWSPLFVLNAKGAEDLAGKLLKVAEESRDS